MGPTISNALFAFLFSYVSLLFSFLLSDDTCTQFDYAIYSQMPNTHTFINRKQIESMNHLQKKSIRISPVIVMMPPTRNACAAISYTMTTTINDENNEQSKRYDHTRTHKHTNTHIFIESTPIDRTGGWSWTWNHGTWPNRWAPWQQQPPGGPAGSSSGHRGGSGTSRGGGGGPWGGSNSSQRSCYPARHNATKYTR